ncbi:TetR/AcrR family transcriptional regulator [Sutcliffiella horikoshii]|uniref:TetR family transcriptional regulator n=1 Tax=Sutcliffiella horikoshii TaxID=79883 RepID=A0A1Y0CIW2_9BACI|nr:TetR/AcrR family transcriptional regulator [Sutcliffiella horikoshii]ART75239.1 TetR family transcriptional regulator [Sutcliffiella horikoshii]TYS58614.1 TetR/AcrR family transcriptional regulator [Sutcliffiella horikoshii]
MKDRKLHVLTCAHKLFIEKGFQATSIQDILDESGIAKGTLYNYFSSKNELLIALFKTLYKNMEKERNDLLIGQDPSDINIFIKQFELQMETNRANKLISLFEEVIFINDSELKDFIQKSQLRMLRWVHQRFLEIFGEEKREYLWDCAIMYLGILNHGIRYYTMTHDKKLDIHRVVQYSVNRLVKIVEDVAESGEVLVEAESMARWVPHEGDKELPLPHAIAHAVSDLKKNLSGSADYEKSAELLDFIQVELSGKNSTPPRRFLVESALETVTKSVSIHSSNQQEWTTLQKLIEKYFHQNN